MLIYVDHLNFHVGFQAKQKLGRPGDPGLSGPRPHPSVGRYALELGTRRCFHVQGPMGLERYDMKSQAIHDIKDSWRYQKFIEVLCFAWCNNPEVSEDFQLPHLGSTFQFNGILLWTSMHVRHGIGYSYVLCLPTFRYDLDLFAWCIHLEKMNEHLSVSSLKNPRSPCMEYVWIFTYIYPKIGPNVGRYSIHGASGNCFHYWILFQSFPGDGLWRRNLHKALSRGLERGICGQFAASSKRKRQSQMEEKPKVRDVSKIAAVFSSDHLLKVESLPWRSASSLLCWKMGATSLAERNP